ncbi:uncharacterized protein LOC117896057 [Drosophila subobscura]|uniref:uncharacterized protein LOC117896057 n=1 Tax=Drosophila subobscura TaxID=7241 RepID=UPI00155A123D|nr:uncharacterized protein LOC117896057 [Drosophila subobscura]
MKTICLLLFVSLLALVNAAPAPQPKAAGNDPTVSVLRYRNDQDLEAIQRAIIAQYEQIGGTTQVHAPRVAHTVNPSSLRINI